MHNYEGMHGTLPPAAVRSTDGKPLLSWRVLILPYIEQDALYRQVKLDEPWDSPGNLPLSQTVVKVYAVPGRPAEPGHTYLRGFIGPKDVKPEYRPWLVEGDAKGVSIANFLDGTTHSFGLEPLSFLHVDGFTSRTRCLEKISLAAKKCGDLQDINDRGSRRALIGRMYIGQHGEASGFADPLERGQSCIESRSPSGVPVRPIRLVKTGLIDDSAGNLLGDLRQRLADSQVELVALQNTGAGDEEQLIRGKEFRHAIPPSLLRPACGYLAPATSPALPRQ